MFEVEPHDAATLGAAGVVLAFAALVAAWLPAPRAQRIDLFMGLRAE